MTIKNALQEIRELVDAFAETKTDKDGAYRLDVAVAGLTLPIDELKITPTLKDYSFKPVTSTWTCKDRVLDFVGTKN